MATYRHDIINYLIEQNGYQTYLEIGICNPDLNFHKIEAPIKVGVDPAVPNSTGPNWEIVRISSDAFFEENRGNFDIIFVDGLHLGDQALRDIENGFRILNAGGVIVVHDCNPPTEWHTRPIEEYEIDNSPWNGTVYQGFLAATQHPNVDFCTVNADWGCGILKKIDETQDILFENFKVSWSTFNKHRNEMLKLTSPEEFRKKYKVSFWKRYLMKTKPFLKSFKGRN
jgi:SAM-dependent methyltransferase